MNKFIACCIICPTILFFVLQDCQQTKNTHYLSNSEKIIAVACEQAKQEGYFTEAIIQEMKGRFTSIGIDADRVVIEVTTTPKYRTDEYDNRELIEYRIGVPIDHTMAANSFWGISDEQNSYIKNYKGALASEKIIR